MTLQLQQTIRNNATQLKQYMNDLYQWQQQMQIKQKIKNNQKQIYQNQQLLHQQQFLKNKLKTEKQALQKQSLNQKNRNKNLIRDTNTVQDYYKAWNKYNPDQQLKTLQQQQKKQYRPYNPYQDSKNNLRAKPKTKLAIKGTRTPINDPTSLKDKGNLHFKVFQYDRAINYYTQCINKIFKQQDIQKLNNQQLLALVYSNRAMSYIKTNQTTKALDDCNQSLKYDKNYIKSYLRRADCFKKLCKYKQSLSDYKKVQQLSPTDQQSQTQIKKLQQFLKQRIKQTQQSMIINQIPTVIPGGYRVQIQQVDEFQTHQNQQVYQSNKRNYLQEL